MIAIQKAFPRERFSLETAAMGVREPSSEALPSSAAEAQGIGPQPLIARRLVEIPRTVP